MPTHARAPGEARASEKSASASRNARFQKKTAGRASQYQPALPASKAKSVANQPFARRGKVQRRAERPTSSTESTNPSEKDKVSSVIALKKEVDEWRRQEALRSRVRQTLGPSYDVVEKDDLKRTNCKCSSKDCSPEKADENKNLTPQTSEDNHELVRVIKMKQKSKRPVKGIIPAVTWIPLQSEISARTSLKSVADYLSEAPDDDEVFVPKRTLCISPDTMKALDDAEKLLEDTDKKLAQLNCDAFNVEDFEGTNSNISGNHIYIRNIVASTFEKGYYDRRSATKRNPLRSKFTLSDLPRSNLDSEHYKCSKILRRLIRSKTKKQQQQPVKVPLENRAKCLFCQTKKCQASAGQPAKSDQSTETTAPEQQTNDQADRLDVQHGPAISIKGLDLQAQTASLVDIQPGTPAKPEKPGNVATYEVRHGEASSDREPSIASSVDERRARRCNQPRHAEEASGLWAELERLDDSLDDLSLRELPVLAEMDALLEHQWRLIRQVQGAAEKFGNFLEDRLPAEPAERDEPARKQRVLEIQLDEELTSASKLTELTRRIELLSTNKPSGFIRAAAALSSLVAEKPAPFMEKPNDLVRATDKESAVVSSEASASSGKHSIASKPLSVKSDKVPEAAAGEAEAIASEHSETSVASRSSGARKQRVSSLEEQQSIDKEIVASRRSSRVSLHTGTRSNSGEIEQVKSTELLEDPISDRQLLNEADLMEIIAGEVKEIGMGVDEKKTEVRKEEERNETTVVAQTEENSQKTSHLIESLSELSSKEVQEYIENSSVDVLHLSKTSNEKSEETARQRKPDEEFSGEQSTESKIERQISEARDSLANLMSSMASETVASGSSSVDAGASKADPGIRVERDVQTDVGIDRDVQTVNDGKSNEQLENKAKSDLQIRTGVESNEQIASRIERDIRVERVGLDTLIQDRQGLSLADSRSYVTMLEENSNAMLESRQTQKMSILKNLESCAIGTRLRSKRLFTSTVIDDVELPGNSSSSVKFKGLSESSSDTHSEGEIRFSSSTSYSLGEIKKKNELSKSTSSIKSSSSNSNRSNKLK